MLPTNTVTKSCWDQGGNHRSLCRDWEGCVGREWFSIADIQYCRNQVIWIIDNLLDYADDHYVTVPDAWPLEPKGETGYNDTPVQHSIPDSASFERFRQVTAEVLHRLERTGMDGRVLLQEVKRAELTRAGNGYAQQYSYEAWQALNYTSGWKRKRMSYSEWKKKRKWRGGKKC